MKERMKIFYMDIAKRTSQLSRAKRLKVGCVIVKDDNILAFSWNGTPKGWENNCEKNIFANATDAAMWANAKDYDSMFPCENRMGQRFRKETLPEVLHAETNAIAKLAKGHSSGDKATMFCTHAPCIECAKLIFQTGITTVYYDDVFRSKDGLKFLKKCNVKVIKLINSSNENK